MKIKLPSFPYLPARYVGKKTRQIAKCVFRPTHFHSGRSFFNLIQISILPNTTDADPSVSKDQKNYGKFKNACLWVNHSSKKNPILGQGGPASLQPLRFCQWHPSFDHNGYPLFKTSTQNQLFFPNSDFIS